MALNKQEQTLVEAIDSMLDGKAHLGLPAEAPKDGGYNDPRLRGLEYLHGQIDDLFAHKASELTHHTGICAAFSKIHNYKYLDDPHFTEALERELVSQGVPSTEREQVNKFIPAIIDELKKEVSGNWSESDFGLHPNLDEIMKASRPEQYEA